MPCQPTFTPGVIAFSRFSIIWEAFFLYDTNGPDLNMICSKNVMLLRDLHLIYKSIECVLPFVNLCCNLITFGYSWRWFSQTEQNSKHISWLILQFVQLVFLITFPENSLWRYIWRRTNCCLNTPKHTRKWGWETGVMCEWMIVIPWWLTIICLLLCTQYKIKIK